MRSAKALLVAGILTVGLPGLAHAQWYAGMDMGADFTQKSKVTGTSSNLDTQYAPGLAEMGHVGYSFGAPKLEVELGYRDSAMKQIGGISSAGDLGVVDYMVNGIYDFMPHSRFHPFVGVGVGGAYLDATGTRIQTTSSYGGKDNEFAYQGFAGLGYDINPSMQASLQYRYFATQNPNFALNTANVTSEYHNQAVLVGFTYKFGAPKPAPAPMPAPAPVAAPAPMPAPAPMVKAAPMPHNYMVFFDFNRAAITPEAANIIREAANSARGGKVARLTLTGYTDAVGSDKYNMALSTKRAEAVKEALVKQGVPADEIAVYGKGKSDPLVPTKDGVREPQNRRVEIVLQ